VFGSCSDPMFCTSRHSSLASLSRPRSHYNLESRASPNPGDEATFTVIPHPNSWRVSISNDSPSSYTRTLGSTKLGPKHKQKKERKNQIHPTTLEGSLSTERQISHISRALTEAYSASPGYLGAETRFQRTSRVGSGDATPRPFEARQDKREN